MTITDLGPDPQGEETSRWRTWRRRFERKQPEPGYDDVISTEVVKWEASDEVEPTGWAWVEKHAISLPDKREVKAKLKHAAPRLPGIFAKHTFVTIPKGMWAEVVQPTWRGAGKCATAYHRWVTAVHLDEAQKVAEGPLKARTLVTRHSSHGYRIWASIIAALAAAGGMAYLYYVHLGYFFTVLISLVCILDLIGRAGQEKKEEFAPAYRELFCESMPYKDRTASIQAAFNEIIGVDGNNHPLVRVDGICSYDFDREEWRQNLSTFEEIKEEHVQTLERSIGAALRSVRILEVPEVATRRVMVVKNGDPLATVPIPPDFPTGSLSITRPLLIGVSVTNKPFAVSLAGVHTAITAATGGAKTKVHMRNIINAVSSCHDARIFGAIDLHDGPEFKLWGDVIMHKAFTPEEADALLDLLFEEKDRRVKLFNEIAMDPSPDNDRDEWSADLGLYLIVLIDEFASLSEYDGKNGKLDLLGKIKKGHRELRKFGISFIRATQATGVEDAGTTVLKKQTNLNIVGPCDVADANSVFTAPKRKAGYTPHLLVPADPEGPPNDAGKCFINGGGFGPDVYRGFMPLTNKEIRSRAAQRVADGLPQLSTPENETIEGKVVPNTLSALAAALDEIEPPDGKLPSAMAAEWISTHSNEEIDATELAKRLRTELSDLAPRAKSMRNKLRGNCSCYLAADINSAMEAL